MKINVGDLVNTPRFCKVRIQHVYPNRESAIADGYHEPTHYDNDPDYLILGKHTGTNLMQFAAAEK